MKYVKNTDFRNSPRLSLVGAGPGDPELISRKGYRLLQEADVVLYDALVSQELLDELPKSVHKVYVGKRCGEHSWTQGEINQFLVDCAFRYGHVVRLKGGDPFVFGRGGEEMADITKASIPVEIVPGITSGIAAPAYANIPVTHRGFSSSVTFVTGHESAGKYRPDVNWQAIAHGSETIVIYMGIHNLKQIVPQLLSAGLSETTEIALIRWGTTPQQEELFGTLATILTLVEEKQFQAPAIAIIGKVVGFRQLLSPITIEP